MEQFATFRLDDRYFGVPVSEVQEVLRYHEMTPVPLVPKVVRGLINLRGQIVTAVDLRQCLGMPERIAAPDAGGEVGSDATEAAQAQLPMNVVLQSEAGGVSLLVDSIGDVIEVDEDAFEEPPETLQGPDRELVRGVYKLDSTLLHVLDTARAMTFASREG